MVYDDDNIVYSNFGAKDCQNLGCDWDWVGDPYNYWFLTNNPCINGCVCAEPPRAGNYFGEAYGTLCE
jgi:uncharacterized protein YycO